MVKDRINTIKIQPIVYIAIIISLISLVVSGYSLTIEGPQGPQGIQGPQGDKGLQGPTGPAGEGDGHSLDTADGTILDVLFVANNEKVGIGMLNPVEKLDIQGNIQISGDYKYQTEKTYYLNIPAVGFHQIDSIWEIDDIYQVSGGWGYIKTNSSPFEVIIHYPVHLTDGTEIKNFTVYYMDISPDNNLHINAYLRNDSLLATTPSNIIANVDFSTINQEYGDKYDDSTSWNIIDNKNSQYYITVNMEIDGTGIGSLFFRGCRIEYTMDSL